MPTSTGRSMPVLEQTTARGEPSAGAAAGELPKPGLEEGALDRFGQNRLHTSPHKQETTSCPLGRAFSRRPNSATAGRNIRCCWPSIEAPFSHPKNNARPTPSPGRPAAPPSPAAACCLGCSCRPRLGFCCCCCCGCCCCCPSHGAAAVLRAGPAAALAVLPPVCPGL